MDRFPGVLFFSLNEEDATMTGLDFLRFNSTYPRFNVRGVLSIDAIASRCFRIGDVKASINAFFDEANCEFRCCSCCFPFRGVINGMSSGSSVSTSGKERHFNP